MTFIKTTSKLINILDWFTTKYDEAVAYVKKKLRACRARRIRKAIDSHNTSAVAKQLRKILKKRQEKHDSN